jgi:hypothetical protein
LILRKEMKKVYGKKLPLRWAALVLDVGDDALQPDRARICPVSDPEPETTRTGFQVSLLHIGIWRGVGAWNAGEDPANLPAESFRPLPGQFFLLTGRGIKDMHRIMTPEAKDKQERFHKSGGLFFTRILSGDCMHNKIIECFPAAAQLAS